MRGRLAGLSRRARPWLGRAVLSGARLASPLFAPPGASAPRRRLRVLVHAPGYPPAVGAGSERSLHTVVTWLAGRGHQVTVMTGDGGGDREVDGVAVCDSPGLLGLVRAYRDHDVVLTQLQATSRALALAALTRRPVVQFLRMGGPDLAKIVRWPDLMVFNAEWLRRERPWPGPSMVLHPPVFAEEYRTAPGDHVTLVNLNERKGGRLLFELARRLPDHRFLGVVGGWGGQVVPDPVPANVTIMDHVDDARDIYARTRILLMPSSYEPYGRVGLEAAASGIPTLASDVAGICEALGDAGTFVPANDVEVWVEAIRELDDPENYEDASRRAKARSTSASPERELEELEGALLALKTRR